MKPSKYYIVSGLAHGHNVGGSLDESKPTRLLNELSSLAVVPVFGASPLLALDGIIASNDDGILLSESLL